MKRKPEHILDELLVMQCQDGDEAALNALVRRWQGPFRRRALQLCGDPELAGDVVQEAWMAIMRGLGRLRDPARFKYWALRIVQHKAADRIRANQRRRRLKEYAARNSEATAPEAGPKPEDERLQALVRVLKRFPEEKRELLRLYYQEELSVAAIAQLLGIAEGTVKSRLFHARALAKKLINASCHEEIER